MPSAAAEEIGGKKMLGTTTTWRSGKLLWRSVVLSAGFVCVIVAIMHFAYAPRSISQQKQNHDVRNAIASSLPRFSLIEHSNGRLEQILTLPTPNDGGLFIRRANGTMYFMDPGDEKQISSVSRLVSTDDPDFPAKSRQFRSQQLAAQTLRD